MKIAICIPIFGGIETPSFFSILESLMTLLHSDDGYDVIFFYTERRPIHIARAELWQMAKHSRCDKMIFLGEDIVLNRDTLIKLAKANFNIYSALYFERSKMYRPMVHRLGKGNKWENHNIEIDGQLQVVDGVGLDCISFSRAVLDEMIPEAFLPFYNYTGDDLSFFIHVKQAGFKVVVDTSHIVGHVSHKKEIIGYEQHLDALGKLFEKSEWHKIQ